jgi:ADP-ribosylglycohydrolase
VRPGDRDWLEDRVRGCLAFATLGDVAGEPFEDSTREEVMRAADPLTGVEQGAVTDDTGQLEALARALVDSGGELTAELWHAALVRWFREAPTAKKAGPTTRARLEGRDVAADERVGVTNGSAMRVAPAGLIHPGDPEAAVELAWLTSRPTHDTQVAAAAAGAIAAGVATALRPGSGWQDVAEACVLGAALGNGLGVREGRIVALPRVSDRIELAVDEARAPRDPDGVARSELDPLDAALERIEAAVGTSMLAFESVPAAVGVFAAAGGDPVETVRAGVRIGGDTDTIAAMAGALAGALHGYAAQEPGDRALLEHVTPPALLGLAPGLAALAAP